MEYNIYQDCEGFKTKEDLYYWLKSRDDELMRQGFSKSEREIIIFESNELKKKVISEQVLNRIKKQIFNNR